MASSLLSAVCRGALKHSLLAIIFAAPAIAAPWDPVKGDWRGAEITSCGIDDVRVGNIMSVNDRTLRYGFIHCAIEGGDTADDGAITINARCDLGGGYEADLSYEWRLDNPNEALMTHEGYTRRLIRCIGGAND